MKQLITGLFLIVMSMSLQAQLPVKLTKFVVQKTNTGISAIWTTTTESNNNYFELQGSNDGINFVTLGRVNAYTTTGDSFVPHDYSLLVSFQKQAGFGLFIIALIAGTVLGSIKRKGTLAIGLSLIAVAAFASCSKSNNSKENAATSYSIYRLAQTDKDGTTAYYGQTN